MSFSAEPNRDVLTPDEVALSAASMTTGFGEYLGGAATSAFDTSALGRAFQNEPPLVGLQAAGKGSRIQTGNPADVIDEPTFKGSTSYRQGMPYETGMTAARQAALAAERDAADYRDSLAARYQGGFWGHVAGFGASLLGGAASPENYIPFIGPEMRGAMMLRMGRVWGGAAAGAIEGLAGTAVTEPLVAQSQQRIGRDYGLPEITADLLMGTTIGGGFGGVHGLLSRAPRVSAELTPESLARDIEGADLGAGELQRQPRPAGDVLTPEVLARETDALNLAADAVARDEPVDVTGLVPERAEPDPGSYIDAFHGTPHSFEAFDPAHIGTGEGAQAYGRGLYYAESRGIAEHYRRSVSAGFFEPLPPGLDETIKWVESGMKKDAVPHHFAEETVGKAQENIEQHNQFNPDNRRPVTDAEIVKELKDWAAAGPPGNLYSVRLHVRPEELLHWDKPLSEQPPRVQDALIKAAPDIFERDPKTGELLYQGLPGKDWTGSQAYAALRRKFGASMSGDASVGQAAASAALRDAGIPGIRYLDAGSRSNWAIREHGNQFQAEDTRTGSTGPIYDTRIEAQSFVDRKSAQDTHNIVLFDPSRAEITHVNDRAVERPVPPPAGLAEAAKRVGKPEDTFAKDAGLEEHTSQAAPVQTAEQKAVAAEKEAGQAAKGVEPKPEPPGPMEADLQALRDAGRLRPEDEAALAEGHAEAEKIDGWADAYESLNTCVTRFGE